MATQPPSDAAVDDDPYPDFEIEPLPSEDVEPLLTEEVDPIETHSATDEVPHPRAAAQEIDAWDLFGEESGVRTGPRPMVAVGPGTPAGSTPSGSGDRPLPGVDDARVSALIAEAERSKPKRPFSGWSGERPSEVPTQDSGEPEVTAAPVPRPLDRAGMFDEVPATTPGMSATERAFFEDPSGAAIDDEPGTQWMPPPSLRSPRPAPNTTNEPLGLAEDVDQLPGERTVVHADTRPPPSASRPAAPPPQPPSQTQPPPPAPPQPAMVVDDGPTMTAKVASGTPTMIRKAYGTHDDDEDVGVTVPAEVSYTVLTWMSVVLGVSFLVVTALVFIVLVYPFW